MATPPATGVGMEESTDCGSDADMPHIDAEFDDDFTKDAELRFRGSLLWWDDLAWAQIHSIHAPTTSHIPPGLEDATVSLKYRLAAILQ